MAQVAGVLLDQVDQDPAQVVLRDGSWRKVAETASPSRWGGRVPRGRCGRRWRRSRRTRPQLLRGVVRGAVPVPVAVGLPVHRRPWLRRRVVGVDLVDPPVLDVREVLEHPAERDRRRLQPLVELGGVEAVGLPPQDVRAGSRGNRPGSPTRIRRAAGRSAPSPRTYLSSAPPTCTRVVAGAASSRDPDRQREQHERPEREHEDEQPAPPGGAGRGGGGFDKLNHRATSAHVRVAVVLRRHEGLLDRARRGPAQQVARGPALSLVPEARAPPNGCWPTTAPVGLSLM